MHQDEAGRWVSDNGRYVWSGSEWIDLEQEPSAVDTGRTEADVPPAADPASRHPDQTPRHRRLAVLLGLLLLVAAGVIAILVVGSRSSSHPRSSAPTPLPAPATL